MKAATVFGVAVGCLAWPAALIVTSPVSAATTAPAPKVEKIDAFTHGPMLGNVSSTSIRIWARTRKPGAFSVVYSVNPDLSDARTSRPVTTSWDHDAAGWVELNNLQPATKYYYGLMINGRIADTTVGGKINSFLTLPNRAAFVDPKLNPKGSFNFAFEVGTGNNQAPGQSIAPTYQRMLENLKERVHFQIQNGDWIYERGRATTELQWAAANGVSQPPKVAQLAQGVAGVWENYRSFLDTSPALANFYREVPLFITLDDHEILNDVTGSGQTGFRIDARGKPFQENIRVDSVQNEVERAVFRDPAVAAWRDYVGWSNPDIGNQRPDHFGFARATAGSDILVDRAADFRTLDPKKISNLHVLWGYGNTGVYRIAQVLDRHRVRVEPALNASEDLRYSIGTNLWSRFRVSNAEFFLLDTRSNRTLHNKDNLADPASSMLGAAQKAWLIEGLRKTDADFVFIVSSVNMAVPHDNGAWYGRGTGGAGKDDGWTAQLYERAEILKVAETLGKPVFFLTGDLHKSFVARVGQNVWDIASGPHTSNNHRIGDAGGSPPSGWYKSGDRLVNILWSSNQYRNDSGGSSSQAAGKGWPIYTVIKVNSAFNIPEAGGKDRWIAHPEPQVIFQFHDGYTGELVYAHSVSTSEAKLDRTPVSAEAVKVLGGIAE